MAVNHSSSSGGSTVVLEMPSRSHHPGDPDKDVQVFEELPAAASSPHSTSIPQLQQWNTPRINMWRCLATFYSFIILGANDGTYGALIPYLETWYNINYTIVSLVFLCPIVGYTASALLNNHIHTVYGQRGVAWIMSVSHLIAYSEYCCRDSLAGPILTNASNSHPVRTSPLSGLCLGVYTRRFRQRPGRQRVVSDALA